MCRIQFIIDRIEGDICVLECADRSHINVNICEISGKLHDGDVVILANGLYHVDYDKTAELRQANIDLQNSLFE